MPKRRPRIKLPTLTCRQCGHQWTPRKAIVYLCPNPQCHSPRWNEPKGGVR